MPLEKDSKSNGSTTATGAHKGHPISPEATANPVSQWFFWWMDGLFRLGHRRPIEEQDLYEVLEERKTEALGNTFERAWEREQQRAAGKGKQPSLFRAIAAVLWKPYFKAFLLVEMGDICQISYPILLRQILTHLQSAQANPDNPPSLGHGFGLAVAMLLLASWMIISYQQFNIRAFRVGIAARTILIDAIFRKATLLSARSRLAFPDGKIINMVSTDISRIDSVGILGLIAVAVGFFIFVVVGLMIDLIGPSALVGAVILLFANPIQAYFMGLLAPIRKEASQIADSRMKLTSEMVQGIKVIKFFAWEPAFLTQLAAYRSQELVKIKRILRDRGFASATNAAIPVFASALTFIIYGATNHKLTPEIIFPVLSYFTILRNPLQILPNCYAAIFDAFVAIRRIEKFLLADESPPSASVDPSHEYALTIDHADFIWEQDTTLSSPEEDNKKKKQETAWWRKRSSKSLDEKNEKQVPQTELSEETHVTFLQDIHLQIPRGSLVAVVGTVGSGKSSLLQAIVGTMTQSSARGGQVIRGSKMSYAPQTPWIQNATIRDNILFGLPMDEAKYERVVKACCLEQDLANLPDGDLTEIGERGVNLSGGQKARLSLARSVYFDVDSMVIMDDPLSAVDAHVGKRLWRDCMLTELKGRTRIIATHQLHVLPDVDYIVCMKDGRIGEQGTYEQLMSDERGLFRELMTQHGGYEDSSSGISQDEDIEDAPNKVCNDGVRSSMDITAEVSLIRPSCEAVRRSLSEKGGDNDNDIQLLSQSESITNAKGGEKFGDAKSTPASSPAKQIVDEDRKKGAVGLQVYAAYFRTAGLGLWSIALFFYALQLSQGLAMNYWLSLWTNDKLGLPMFQYIIVYVVFAIDQLSMGLTATALLARIIIKTTRTIHDRAMEAVLRAPLAFFDTTPTGRILNRFSKDVSDLDNLFWQTLNDMLVTGFNVLGSIILVIIFFPWLTLAIIPIGLVYYFICGYYLSTSRELKRLDSTCRSFLFAHFSENLYGMTILRAFGVTQSAIQGLRPVMDRSNRPFYLFITAARWLALRVNLLGTLIQFATAMMIIGTRFTMNPATAGLVMSYLSRLSGDMFWALQNITTMENNMNAAERLNHYIENLPSEPPAKRPDNEPPASWPSQGAIEFSHVSMSYRPGLPRVLQDVSFKVEGGHKIGVVGRTGAGKSSLIQALFRLADLDEGSNIFIDGLETGTLGTADLRTKIAIIPQDPVLFQGTFRYNLDPRGDGNNTQDDQLWRALETAGLKNYVQEQEGGLDAAVAAQGGNLSVGQRQLVCLARALLAKSKIVVLDEATASVDLATDVLIQKAIREDFASSTVVTIAHRLNTVIDYDRILVMDHGRVAEYASAKTLLENPNSIFSSLVDETGEQNAALLRSMAGCV